VRFKAAATKQQTGNLRATARAGMNAQRRTRHALDKAGGQGDIGPELQKVADLQRFSRN
jgi:hypothetical protein